MATRLIIASMGSIVAGLARARGRSALWASLLLILLATLPPSQWIETEGRPESKRIADILLNVTLFAPLGATLGHRGRSATAALLVGALLSGAIEIAQLGVPGRVTSLEDVLSNTVGTIAGWVLCRTAPVWVRPGPKAAGWLSLAAASMASTVLGLTGLLLGPSFPSTRYFGEWTPEFGHLRVYHGQVLEASLGGRGSLPGQSPTPRISRADSLRARRYGSAPWPAPPSRGSPRS